MTFEGGEALSHQVFYFSGIDPLDPLFSLRGLCHEINPLFRIPLTQSKEQCRISLSFEKALCFNNLRLQICYFSVHLHI
jgi:hypothetical protein